jgi:dUTP pyrophosphatase
MLRFSKVRNVKSPVRGTKKSAGIDLFLPVFDNYFKLDVISKNLRTPQKDSYSYYMLEKSLLLSPNSRILLPAGIKFNLDEHPNTALVVHNKSGVASKKGLDRMAEVIDEDYQGEVHISLVNTSPYIVEIHENEKIIQLLHENVNYTDLDEVHESVLYYDISERGEGGFGHTDLK